MPKIIWTNQDRDSLLKMASRIERIASKFRVLVKEMEDNHVSEMECENYDTLMKSIGGIDTFVFRAEQRLHNILLERGDYVAKGEPAPIVQTRLTGETKDEFMKRMAKIKKKS